MRQRQKGDSRRYGPWTHTSDDSFICQLSLVLATAIVSFSSKTRSSLKFLTAKSLVQCYRVLLISRLPDESGLQQQIAALLYLNNSIRGIERRRRRHSTITIHTETHSVCEPRIWIWYHACSRSWLSARLSVATYRTCSTHLAIPLLALDAQLPRHRFVGLRFARPDRSRLRGPAAAWS